MEGDTIPDHLFWQPEDHYTKMWVYIAKTLSISKFEAMQHSPADYLALVIDNNLSVSRENYLYDNKRQDGG